MRYKKFLHHIDISDLGCRAKLDYFKVRNGGTLPDGREKGVEKFAISTSDGATGRETKVTCSYPEEKNPTSIIISLNISNHWYIKTPCVIIKSSHLTIWDLYRQPTHCVSNFLLSVFHCHTNKNREFSGHIKPGLLSPGFA